MTWLWYHIYSEEFIMKEGVRRLWKQTDMALIPHILREIR